MTHHQLQEQHFGVAPAGLGEFGQLAMPGIWASPVPHGGGGAMGGGGVGA
ncbi:hypothetical protein [Nocardia sp. NPDC050717]